MKRKSVNISSFFTRYDTPIRLTNGVPIGQSLVLVSGGYQTSKLPGAINIMFRECWFELLDGESPVEASRVHCMIYVGLKWRILYFEREEMIIIISIFSDKSIIDL
jgi:hypothetical protein